VNSRKRAYKYRFYPTPEQEVLLAQTFGCVRKVYNLILEWRSLAYQERQEKINYLKASARLTEIKRLPEVCLPERGLLGAFATMSSPSAKGLYELF